MKYRIAIILTCALLSACALKPMVVKSEGINGSTPDQVSIVTARSVEYLTVEKILNENDEVIYPPPNADKEQKSATLWWAILKPGTYKVEVHCHAHNAYGPVRTIYTRKITAEPGKLYGNIYKKKKNRLDLEVHNWNDVDPTFYEPLKDFNETVYFPNFKKK